MLVPSNSGFKKFADSNPSATLAPHRTMGTGVFAEAMFTLRVDGVKGKLMIMGARDPFCIIY